MEYPRIYLVLDNCFAIKRWIKPREWMELARETGFRYVQTSTDNEIDPLFSTPEYMDDWFAEAARCERSTGVKLVNFYTGYQTYRTAGLAHHDKRIVEHIKQDWIYNLVRRIEKCGADGLGFSFFAIPDEAMQDPAKHAQAMDSLFEELYDIADFAYNHGVKISMEQMYVPYQPPFTISQSKQYLKTIYDHSKHPLYLTIDVGHMTGQAKFLMPSEDQIIQSFSHAEPDIWLGSNKAYKIWQDYKAQGDFTKGAGAIFHEMERCPYLFAAQQDADVYAWLEQLAKYSPIIHMQQTDGVKANHAAFTPVNNKTGIITGEKLLRAIAKSCESSEELQPPVQDIYLSFELFFANVETNRNIMNALRQTLAYWRQFVPEDGMRLDELIKQI